VSVKVKDVIMIGVALMVIALILPLGLGLLGLAGDTVLVVYNATGLNESAITLADAVDPSVMTLVSVLIPILAVIGIAIGFVSFKD
jgi:hypothetical protein